MKVELHVNGSHQVILIPENLVQQAILREMAEAAGKGRAVKITAEVDYDADPSSLIRSVTVSVEA